jgi:hypothetical protein
VKKAALVFSLALLLLALFALAIEERLALCPGGALFSCATLVRPPLRALGPLPLAPALALFAATEAMAALLLLVRDPKPRFARDVALLAAFGAGFALGLQPLALLVSRRPCLVCLLAVFLLLALAFLFSKIAQRGGASSRASLLAFSLALVSSGALATTKGLAQRKKDQDARERLRAFERKDARVVLVEREGCPYCEALAEDVLAKGEVLARLERTGLARRSALPGEPAPILLGLDREGHEAAREAGFKEDPASYEAVLRAAER